MPTPKSAEIYRLLFNPWPKVAIFICARVSLAQEAYAYNHYFSDKYVEVTID